MKSMMIFLLLMVVAVGNVIEAAETRLEGVLMGGYTAYLSEFKADGTGANDFNAFMINRIYLTGSAKLSEKMNGKIVLEGNSLTAGNAIFLKLAYLEWKGLADGLTVAAGLAGTPWRGFEEGIWKYRFVEKIQEDLESLLKPADHGVKATYQLPGKSGVVEAMVSNGEGFSAVEVSRDKDVQARVIVVPLPESLKEFSFSVYGLYGKANTDRRRERVMALVAYDQPSWTVAGSMITAWDQATGGGGVTTQFGFSIYGSVILSESWGVLARMDSFDPDVDVASNKRTRVIAGFSYDCGEGVKLALTDHWVIQEAEAVTRKNQHAIQINLGAKF